MYVVKYTIGNCSYCSKPIETLEVAVEYLKLVLALKAVRDINLLKLEDTAV